MRLTVLGSGTLLPDPDRGSAAHLVEDAAACVLLDCGAGVLGSLARAGCGTESLTHVVLSHFHADHIGALPSLLWAARFGAEVRGPLTVVGPVGLRRRWHALADAFGAWFADPGFILHLVEVEPGGEWFDDRVRVATHPTEHTEHSMAVRIDGRGGVVGYTGDTGPTVGLGAFFRGVDLLVSECASGDEDPRDGHLTPSSVAALAREADVTDVVITHVYPEWDPQALAAAVERAGVPGRCVAGYDGLVVPLDATRPAAGA